MTDEKAFVCFGFRDEATLREFMVGEGVAYSGLTTRAFAAGAVAVAQGEGSRILDMIRDVGALPSPSEESGE